MLHREWSHRKQCVGLALQDGLSQLPGERSGEGSEAAGADAGTALSSPRPAAAAGGGSSLDADIAAPSLCADSEAAGSTDSSSRPRGGKGGAGGGMCSNRQREEDFYGVCHADVVKCIVITDSGKIFTAGCVPGSQGRRILQMPADTFASRQAAVMDRAQATECWSGLCWNQRRG